MGTLDDKTALVTGGTRGIGYAIADKLLNAGAAVTVTGTAPGSDIPNGAKYEVADFSSWGGIEDFCAKISKRYFNVVVNNAGINIPGLLESVNRESLERVHLVNVFAPILICQAVVNKMQERRSGHIVNISSIWGVMGRTERAVYASTKFALDGFTASIAAELAEHGVLANCVAPGFVKTDMTCRILGDEGINTIARSIPLKRFADPSEIAELVLWLVSPSNTYITGQNIVIDGGLTRASTP